MFQRRACQFGAIAFLLLFMTAGVNRQLRVAVENEGRQKRVSRQKMIRSQVRDDFEEAARANAQATTLTEWASSGYTPQDVLQNVRALRSPEAWKTACQALGRLNPGELALFEEEILRPENARSLTCAPALKGKIDSFWNFNRVSLAARQANDRAEADSQYGPPAPAAETEATVRAEIPQLGQVAITFDGGPHPSRTLRALQALRAADVKAMFFMAGKKSALHAEIAREVVAQGHGVGIGSWNSSIMRPRAIKEAEREILSARDAIASSAGLRDVKFFRMPSGTEEEDLLPMMRRERLIPTPSEVDSQDWKIRDSQLLIEHVMAELERSHGGTLVLHDNMEATVTALPALIERIRGRGFELVLLTPDRSLTPLERVRPALRLNERPIRTASFRRSHAIKPRRVLD
jgi:peptidoglycan-N-acetylglucosamine deacetylase